MSFDMRASRFGFLVRKSVGVPEWYNELDDRIRLVLLSRTIVSQMFLTLRLRSCF